MFNRQIARRIETLAPFLRIDNYPYIVLADGKLFWIVDAYTVSMHYPYSEPFLLRSISQRDDFYRDPSGATARLSSFSRINYVRNSVKG
jgi:uncharacterized membrane protein (UPF0182 family)